MIKDIIKALYQFLKDMFCELEKADAEDVIIEPVKTNSEKFLEHIESSYEKDISPRNLAPQELSCAEGVSELIRFIYPDFKIQISTAELKRQLDNDPRFKRTLEPKRGVIIVSPRTRTVNGHIGTCVSTTKIASNDSMDGKFRINYTWESWIREFKQRRGLRIFLYEMI